MNTKLHSSFVVRQSVQLLLAVITLFSTASRSPAQTNWGGALSFDGVNDYVLAPLGIWFSNQFTIETWVYERSYGNWSRVLDFGNGAPSENIIFGLSFGTSGRPLLQIYPSGEYVSPTNTLPLNQWVHLAATLQSNTAVIYINGTALATNTVTAPNAVLRVTNYIGRSHWGVDAYPKAIFDDLRIWKVARTGDEIRDGMTHPLTGTESNLVAYWKFDVAGGTRAYDATTNHLDATLMNRPLRVPSRWTPMVALNGTNPFTNACRAVFADPGAFASAPPPVIAAGCRHSLAVQPNGVAFAWGNGSSGQVPAPANATNAVAVAGGENHSLALRADGSVVGWGSYGSIPANATNLVAIAAGYYHSLGLKPDGTVVGWGSNTNGQATIPPSATNAVMIAGGGNFSLALRGDGTVVGWGGNTYGQTNSPASATNVVMIAAGYAHSLALKADGTLVAWGAGGVGQSGDPHYGQCIIPANATNIVAIAGGGWHSLALRADGSVIAWGLNGDGQTNRPAAATNVMTIGAGGAFNLALRRDGVIIGWGNNDWGQSGIPAGITNLNLAVFASGVVDTNTPGLYDVTYRTTNSLGAFGAVSRTVRVVDVPAADSTPVTGLSVVGTNLSARFNGSANPNGLNTVAWFEWGGSNAFDHVTTPVAIGSAFATVAVSNAAVGLPAGVICHCRLVASNSLGVARGEAQWFSAPGIALNGPTRQTNECHLFTFDDPVAAVGLCQPALAGGDSHSLALKADGAVLGWGTNDLGQADGVPAGNAVVAIASRGPVNLALQADGSVVGWGSNANGQTNPPVTATNVTAVAVGQYHCLALRGDGTVVGWGNNGYGQTTIPASATNMSAIAAGEYYSLALRSDGSAVGWGSNEYGETNIPASASNVLAIAAGLNHGLALRADGNVIGWGRNFEGQINVPAGATNVLAIMAGGHHSLALRADGIVLGWGNNNYGQANGTLAGTNNLAIAAGRWHSLALKADGTVVGWGRNDFGQTSVPASATNLNLVLWSSGTVDTDSPGTNVLSYTLTNTPGVVATATRTIVVRDTLPPVLVLLGTNSLVLEVGIPYTDAGATAADVCFGDLTASIVSNLTVNINGAGLYTNRFTVTDPSGNVAVTNRIVRMVDEPLVTTLSATDIAAESVTLRGQVNPNGLETVAWLEWGATTNYGDVTTASSAGNGFANVVPTASLSSLTLGAVYHYRAWASNSLAVVHGSDQSFTAGHQTVTTLSDSGAGSLRQALADAGAGSTIYLSVTGTITLTSAELTIADNVNLVGPAFTNLHVSGNDARRVFYVNAGVTSVVSGLTIRNGRSPGGGTGANGSPGGCIYNAGNLTLNDCDIANGHTGNGGTGTTGANGDPGGSGGAGGAGGNGAGIYNHNTGVLAVNRCTISASFCGVGGQGGRGGNGESADIFGADDGGPGGTGGAGGFGGGIYNAGILTVNCSTVSGNQDGDGGTGGSGGNGYDYYLDRGNGGNGGTGGVGGRGGGIYNANSLTLTCCTIAGNSVGSGGAGGERGYGEVNGSSGSPGSGGQGGGVHAASGSSQCINSIVAGNSATNVVGRDVAGAFVSLGHNLIGQRDGSTGFTNGVLGNLVGTYASPLNPLLGPLAYHGGTPTRALLAGSPALNAGDTSAGCPTDQRGVTRCGRFDIGAYEAEWTEPPTLVLLGNNPLTHLARTPFADPGATATDVCGADLTGIIVSNITVNSAVPGIYTNTFSVTDAGTNTVVTNRTVSVVDWPQVSGLTAYLAGTNIHGGSRVATLQVTVNPNGLQTVAFLRYGLSTAYSGSGPAALLGSYSSSNLTASFDGLIPGVTYHWHVYASNTLGLAYVPDQTFTVPAIFAPGDANGDGIVDQAEFAGVLAGLNGSGVMNEAQLNLVLSNYYASSPWLYITNAAGLGGTNVTFGLSNSTAGTFSVLMSTNLVDWEYLGPATPRYQFLDTNAPALPKRYYRLTWP